MMILREIMCRNLQNTIFGLPKGLNRSSFDEVFLADAFPQTLNAGAQGLLWQSSWMQDGDLYGDALWNVNQTYQEWLLKNTTGMSYIREERPIGNRTTVDLLWNIYSESQRSFYQALYNHVPECYDELAVKPLAALPHHDWPSQQVSIIIKDESLLLQDISISKSLSIPLSEGAVVTFPPPDPKDPRAFSMSFSHSIVKGMPDCSRIIFNMSQVTTAQSWVAYNKAPDMQPIKVISNIEMTDSINYQCLSEWSDKCNNAVYQKYQDIPFCQIINESAENETSMDLNETEYLQASNLQVCINESDYYQEVENCYDDAINNYCKDFAPGIAADVCEYYTADNTTYTIYTSNIVIVESTAVPIPTPETLYVQVEAESNVGAIVGGICGGIGGIALLVLAVQAYREKLPCQTHKEDTDGGATP